MGSSFTAVVTVVQDPETLELGGKPCTKLRLVDKALSKKHEDRFFNMLCFGYDAETAGRLAKGDKIHVTGTLALTSYVSKKTKQKVTADEMGFGSRILQVIQSPSFFEGKKDAAEPPPAAESDFGPGTTGAGPLDDIAF
jgi:single-stranded DNA-binding protein